MLVGMAQDFSIPTICMHHQDKAPIHSDSQSHSLTEFQIPPVRARIERNCVRISLRNRLVTDVLSFQQREHYAFLCKRANARIAMRRLWATIGKTGTAKSMRFSAEDAWRLREQKPEWVRWKSDAWSDIGIWTDLNEFDIADIAMSIEALQPVWNCGLQKSWGKSFASKTIWPCMECEKRCILNLMFNKIFVPQPT